MSLWAVGVWSIVGSWGHERNGSGDESLLIKVKAGLSSSFPKLRGFNNHVWLLMLLQVSLGSSASSCDHWGRTELLGYLFSLAQDGTSGQVEMKSQVQDSELETSGQVEIKSQVHSCPHTIG